MRTSQTHPLQIANVRAAPHFGAVGITFCPGKKQTGALTGDWDRDLDVDLDAVARWGAAAIVTLVESHELEALQVTGLGDAVARRHMAWFHLPVRDFSAPSAQFDESWRTAGEGLRDILRAGFNVLVHCKGGLGRAGTIAAKLLVELGQSPGQAIGAVRAARPGAIETEAQLAYVKNCRPAPEPQPATSGEAVRDRAVGALLGLALGDAVGTTLEFSPRDTYPPLTGLTGGGPFRLRAGEWTDDTAMALALADSLAFDDRLDAADLMQRFVRWKDHGEYSCTGVCFDIGATTAAALARWRRSGDPYAGLDSPRSAGNGSLMRLAPVAIRHWRDRDRLRDVASRQSRTTHAAPEAVDACVAYAEALADAIEGRPRSEVLRAREGAYAGAIAAIAAGGWRGKLRREVNASGYVAHALDAALWSVGRSAHFEHAVIAAANLGQDADTTAAIAGQLAGALCGAAALPRPWLDKLAMHDRLRGAAEALCS